MGPGRVSGGGLGSGLARRGLRDSGRAIPGVQVPESKKPGNTAQILSLWKGRGQENIGQPGCSCRQAPLNCEGRWPHTWSPEHPGSRGLGVEGRTEEADSRAGEVAAKSVVFPHYVTLCQGRSRAPREHGPHRINSSH